MTDLELAEKFIHLVQTKRWGNRELQKAYDDLCEVADVDHALNDSCEDSEIREETENWVVLRREVI